MVSRGVDVMLRADNHVSEVFRPIGASGTSATPVLSATGIRAFTAGGGGAENSYSWQFLPVPGMTFTNVGTTGSFSGSDSCH
jgi:hypothetical protein